MPRAFSLKSPILWAFAVGACLAASCDGRGVTSTCPPLPLYQTYPLGDASPADAASADSAEVQLALEAAYDAGCATRPTDFPYEAGAGGEAGDGGASSRAGSAAGGSGSAGSHAGAAADH
ncbi:MAG TPA: hypothetical protein VER04_21410 [Polyangiaceae bacterium]|nr:hypothetical protein [Polyangiaceae bacterium]